MPWQCKQQSTNRQLSTTNNHQQLRGSNWRLLPTSDFLFLSPSHNFFASRSVLQTLTGSSRWCRLGQYKAQLLNAIILIASLTRLLCSPAVLRLCCDYLGITLILCRTLRFHSGIKSSLFCMFKCDKFLIL